MAGDYISKLLSSKKSLKKEELFDGVKQMDSASKQKEMTKS